MLSRAVMPDKSASERLREWIDTYCATERHPAWAKFSVHGPFNYPDLWNSPRPQLLEQAGCYVIYGAGGELRYIGMSLTGIGDRLAVHFGAPTQTAEFWANGPKATFVEAIEVISPWEPPSLEAYLVARAREHGYGG